MSKQALAVLFLSLISIGCFSNDTIIDPTEARSLPERFGLLEKKLENIELQNQLITQNSETALQFSQSVVDWTAMIFGAITLIFLIAAVIGIRELSQISKTKKELLDLRQRLDAELKEIESFKEASQKNTAAIIEKIESESKSYLKAIYSLNSGIRNFRQGNSFLAETEFREALKLFPNDYMANCYLARTCFSQGKYLEGNQILNKAIELDDRPHFAYYLKGENYRRLGEYDLAIEALTKAAEIEKKTTIYNGLGFAYLKKGEYQKAKNTFESSLNINRNDSSTCGIAKTLLMMGKTKEAGRYFEETILLAEESTNKNRNQTYAYLNLAFAHSFFDRSAESAKSLSRAIENNDSSAILNEQLFDYDMVMNAENVRFSTAAMRENKRILESKVAGG
ncbi:MAG: tetratricopeptide repeat protein [Lewinellaceae bacterium]|nr:tetratricopeptide repeat protein [Lewinellaceae bacterium]